MNSYEYIKHISHEDFKKLDINLISYVQMYNGEILMIDHPYLENQNIQQIDNEEKNNINNQKDSNIENVSNKKKRKRKKNKNKNKNKKKDNISSTNNGDNNFNEYMNYSNNTNNYDNYSHNNNYFNNNSQKKGGIFTLPNEFFESNLESKRFNSVIVRNKGRILFNEEWKDLQDYDFNERIKFYDCIPKRAKFWERESYDSTRSLFQSKRIEKMNNYNKVKEYNGTYNYTPIPKEDFSEEEYEENTNYNEYQINNSNQEEYNEISYPLNLGANQKDLYNLAFGPKIAQYILEQQQNNYNSGFDYSDNNNYMDYYETTPLVYDNYNKNNYDLYGPYYYKGNDNNNSVESKENNNMVTKK